MQLKYHELSDELQEKIDEQVNEIAEYEVGDLVTVEPTDHGINYAGSHLEGCPLQIDGIEPYWVDLSTTSWDRAEHRTDNGESTWNEYIPINDYDDELYCDLIVIGDPKYSFQRTDEIMGEHSLMGWEKFRAENDISGRVAFPRKEGSAWAKKTRNPCHVCGCKWVKLEKQPSPPGDLEEQCAVCGYNSRHETFDPRTWS